MNDSNYETGRKQLGEMEDKDTLSWTRLCYLKLRLGKILRATDGRAKGNQGNAESGEGQVGNKKQTITGKEVHYFDLNYDEK